MPDDSRGTHLKVDNIPLESFFFFKSYILVPKSTSWVVAFWSYEKPCKVKNNFHFKDE